MRWIIFFLGLIWRAGNGGLLSARGHRGSARRHQDFVVQDAERRVTLSQFKGQVVVLNFWASWCPPCVAETPSLVRMQQKLKDKGVVVVAISADDNGAYHRFINKYGMDFVTVRDPSAKIQHMYGTIQIPETYIIDRDGVLRRKFANAFDWSTPEVTDFLSKL